MSIQVNAVLTLLNQWLLNLKKRIATAVVALTKQPGYKIEAYIKQVHQNELAHIAKLADRLHNLLDCLGTTVAFLQKKQALETRQWYLDESAGTVFAEEIAGVLVALEKNLTVEL